MLSYFCTYQKSILGDTNPISAEIPKATKQAAGKENGSVLPGLVSDSDESCHKAASEAGITLSTDSKNYRKELDDSMCVSQLIKGFQHS